MSPDLGGDARDLLNTLLDRFEQPQRQTVVRVRLSAKDHPRYFATDDPAPRRETHLALEQLERDGLVRLRWVKWERGNWLQSVDLVPEQASRLYALLDRTPRAQQTEQLESLLAFESPRAEWHASFLSWAQAQLAQHRSVAPLSLDDPRKNRDLLRALAALAALRQPVLERTLSVRLFNDSKRLESLRPAIVQVLRRHHPQAADYGDDTWAMLAAQYLDRVPEYVPLAGPLLLQHDDRWIDPGACVPSVAVSATTLRMISAVACAASLLVTVENATSFSELVAARPPQVLALYTAGFASPSIISLLQRLRDAQPTLPFVHWGDCDVGGLRILSHLRSRLGPVAPLLMDRPTFDRYRSYGQPLSAGDRAALKLLRSQQTLDDCTDLIDGLLAADQKLEQEAIDVADLLDTLSTQFGIDQ